MDLLVTSSDDSSYVVACDFTKTIADTLMDNVGPLDADCAWIIADYLPKRVVLDPADHGLNAKIVYSTNHSAVTPADAFCGVDVLCDRIQQKLCIGQSDQSVYDEPEPDFVVTEYLESSSDSDEFGSCYSTTSGMH